VCHSYPYQAQGLKSEGIKKMVKLTKAEQYKVQDIMQSIYGGVAIALDPINDPILYKTIVNRLGEELAELKQALNIKN
jgi:hypothetical protein